MPNMLTGDVEGAGHRVAAAVGMDPSHCRFSMKPVEKQHWISSREAKGIPTLMLGDGINDSTALATATVGVAMGETSAALAAASADIVPGLEEFVTERSLRESLTLLLLKPR